MLTRTVLKLVCHHVNYGYSIGAVSFYWDAQRRRFVRSSSRLRRCVCVVVLAYLLAAILFLVEKMHMILIHKAPEDPQSLVLLTVYMACIAIALSTGACLYVNDEYMVDNTNHYLQYFLAVAGKLHSFVCPCKKLNLFI